MPEDGSTYEDRWATEHDPRGGAVPWLMLAVLVSVVGVALGLGLPWDWIVSHLPVIDLR